MTCIKRPKIKLTERKKTTGEKSTYQFHEATPLSILKVPKNKLKVKVLKPIIGGAIGQSLIGFDGKVPCLRFLYGVNIAILEAEMLMLVLQFVVDILLSVFLQELGRNI